MNVLAKSLLQFSKVQGPGEHSNDRAIVCAHRDTQGDHQSFGFVTDEWQRHVWFGDRFDRFLRGYLINLVRGVLFVLAMKIVSSGVEFSNRCRRRGNLSNYH